MGAVLAGGRYRLEKPLGRGGMGQVYEAFDTSTDRRVALKCLRTDRAPEKQQRNALRFRREYHSLATLKHPRVIEVFDFQVDPERGPFYTMELLDGRDLKELVGELSLKEVCRLLRDVAAGLAMLHTHGIVHRDVAPKNVRCTADGHAKLIDFGVSANVGAAGEIAGTLPYIAPESVRGMPLDGRTDLYSLGALAYQLLTGEVPHAVRRLQDLERAWQRPAVPPSHIDESIPEAMNELVMSLLCQDPMGRPSSAAEVIERLTGIGGLEPAPDIAVAQGYLASAAMVGRRHEMKVLRTCVRMAVEGNGNAAFVEADSGTGKSRLLREVALEARVAGSTVAEVSCETAAGGPYDVIRGLLDALWKAIPDEVAAAGRPHAPTLLRLFPELAQHLGDVEVEEAAADPAEQRMRMQRAVADWLTAIAQKRPIALFIDDVQRCDEASAAVLASVTRECGRHALLVVIALRSNEAIRARNAVGAMRRAPTSLYLSGLETREIEDLVRSLFGETKNTRRLAIHMREVTDGSPLLCTELCRHLVDEGVIRYEDGDWHIPNSIEVEGPPLGLAAAMESRIAKLSREARALGEALSIHGGELPLELIVDLAGDTDEDMVFAALDELTQQGVLVGRGDSFRFRHDGLREALLRGLREERKQLLHLRVAEALSRGKTGPAREAELGWHFHAGGDHDRAVGYLDSAGRRLFEAQALSDCIASLEAAVEIYRERAAPRAKYMELLGMLLAAGWVSNREVGERHAAEAVHTYRRYVGMALADRLGLTLGRHLAFVIGLSIAMVSWVFSRPSRRGPRPDKALVQFMVSLGYASGLANAANHLEELRRYVRLADVFDILKNRFPHAACLGIQSFPDIVLGRLGHGAKKLSRSVEIMVNDRLTPATDFERRLGEAGMRGLRALIDVNQLNPRLHEDLDRCAELGLRYYQLVAKTTLVVHHRYRGEESKARDIEREIEATSLQLGSWSTDLQILLFAHPAYAICRDVMGLKRCLRELEMRCEEGMAFQNRVDMVNCELLRERGDFEGSLHEGMKVVEDATEENVLFRQWGWSAIAETHLAAGDWEQAAIAARNVLAIAEDPDLAIVIPVLRCQRILGMAEFALGGEGDGIARLERAILEAEKHGAPSLAGLMHEARARVALEQGDRPTYLHHSNEASRWLRATENPCLIAISERLIDAGAPRTRQRVGDRGAMLRTVADVPSKTGPPRALPVTVTEHPTTGTSDETSIRSAADETALDDAPSFDKTLSERPDPPPPTGGDRRDE